MHIFFSGIGGTGIGPLALIAKQAGYDVSGSDKQNSSYLDYLKKQGITDIAIGQSEDNIAKINSQKPIDWLVYSSAIPKENPGHPELVFAKNNGIKCSKRDEFLSTFLEDKNLKMIAVAGTHGKTTTTAMAIWLFGQLKIPISYSVGAKLSFGDMGHYDPKSEYFIYEADEYDRNFLAFKPFMSVVTGIAWDHPDIYPTRENYYQAFRTFLDQSQHAYIWQDDAQKLGLVESSETIQLIKKQDYAIFTQVGRVNRENAAIATQAIGQVLGKEDIVKLGDAMDSFPGVSRRFEKIRDNLYTDYAHTPEKIQGALQLAQEVAGKNVVVIYEGLHNTRQHFIKKQLASIFSKAKKLYVVPNYRAREDETLEDLTPKKLTEIITKPKNVEPSQLDKKLKKNIEKDLKNGELVLCLSAGGGNSLDEWLRQEFI